jgi:cell wall assembly regulator SMI1
MVPLSLDEALARREEERRLAAELSEAFGEGYGPPDAVDASWLPLITVVHGGFLAADLGVPPGGTPQVWRYEHDRPPGRVVAASLAELAQALAELMADGWWTWDTEGGRWVVAEQLPPARLRPFHP